jgi:hypothetical protein
MLGYPVGRGNPSAKFLTAARSWGALPLRTRQASSPSVTSRTWCSRFSMDLSYCPPSDKLCERGIESHHLDSPPVRTNEISRRAALVLATGLAVPDDSIAGDILSTPAVGPFPSCRPTLPKGRHAQSTGACVSSLSFASRATCMATRLGSAPGRATRLHLRSGRPSPFGEARAASALTRWSIESSGDAIGCRHHRSMTQSFAYHFG